MVIICSVYGELEASLIKIEWALFVAIMTRGNNPLKIKTTMLINDSPLAIKAVQLCAFKTPHHAIRVSSTSTIKIDQVDAGFLAKKSVEMYSSTTNSTSPTIKTGYKACSRPAPGHVTSLTS